MKKIFKTFAVILTLAILLTSFPTQVEAASIKLNKTKTTLYIGQTRTLKLIGTNKKATWKSSNKKIATVSEKGKITAKKAGSTTITAKIEKNTYKCKVTVKKPQLNYTSKNMYLGISFTLKLKGADIKKMKSSNRKVATVDKTGKVLAKGEGNATITVTSKDGKTYKCTVTVARPENWQQVYDMYVWYDMGEYFFLRVNSQEEVMPYTRQFPLEYWQLLKERYPDRAIIQNGTGPNCAVFSALYTDPEKGFPIWSIDYIWN